MKEIRENVAKVRIGKERFDEEEDEKEAKEGQEERREMPVNCRKLESCSSV